MLNCTTKALAGILLKTRYTTLHMPPINFASTNKEKFANAYHVCSLANIQIEQVFIDIDEIQGENPQLIIEAKAKAAYAALGKPVMVSDDSWSITALNGFPGAYMKSMNYWFKPEDFLRLVQGLTDRSVTLQQYLAYHDGREIVTFSAEVPGQILNSNYGDTTKAAWMNVVTMDGDNGKSLAEIFNQPESEIRARYEKRPEVWSSVVTWYKEKYS